MLKLKKTQKVKNTSLLNISVSIGAIFFHILFWKEQMGLNTLLFTLLVLTALRFLYPENQDSRSVLLLAGGLLISSIFVTIHSSFLSKTIYWVTFILLAGKVQEEQIRLLFLSFLLAFISFFKVPINFIRSLGKNSDASPRWQIIKRNFKLIIIPIIVVFVFFQIYATANVKFAEMSRQLGNFLSEIFFFDFSFTRIIHIFIGFLLLGMLFFKNKNSLFESIESIYSDTLQRHRKPKKETAIPLKILGLKQEYQIGIVLLISLNVLIFLVNLTDFRYVWFNKTISSPQELSNFVHEGTYFLILSIFIAAGVLIWFFRGNLNFYKNNDLLKKLAFLWIIQNGILVFSVAKRNWKYIAEYGLAHKRVGVFIFLIMVLTGLVFLYFKIEKKRSFFHLLVKNSWTVWLILLLASFINWDVAITRYNLSGEVRSEKIDSRYLTYGMSTKNLFLLKDNEALLIFNGEQNGNINVQNWIYNKESKLKKQIKKHSWLSWSYSDWRNFKYLEEE